MRASLSVRADADELRRVIGFAEKFAHRHVPPSAERARLVIILEELFTNAVNHGYHETGGGRIEIALAFDGTRLRIEFSDDGRPFDPLRQLLPDLDQPPVERKIGRLGLHIVRSLVDDARYARDGDRNCLVLIRAIPCSE